MKIYNFLTGWNAKRIHAFIINYLPKGALPDEVTNLLSSQSIHLEVRDSSTKVIGLPVAQNELLLLLRYSSDKIPKLLLTPDGIHNYATAWKRDFNQKYSLSFWIDDNILLYIRITYSGPTFPREITNLDQVEIHGLQTAAHASSSPISPAVLAWLRNPENLPQGYMASTPNQDDIVEYGGSNFYIIGNNEFGDMLVCDMTCTKIFRLTHDPLELIHLYKCDR